MKKRAALSLDLIVLLDMWTRRTGVGILGSLDVISEFECGGSLLRVMIATSRGQSDVELAVTED